MGNESCVDCEVFKEYSGIKAKIVDLENTRKENMGKHQSEHEGINIAIDKTRTLADSKLSQTTFYTLLMVIVIFGGWLGTMTVSTNSSLSVIASASESMEKSVDKLEESTSNAIARLEKNTKETITILDANTKVIIKNLENDAESASNKTSQTFRDVWYEINKIKEVM